MISQKKSEFSIISVNFYLVSLLAKFDQEFLILGDSRLKKIPGWKFFEIYSTENTPGIHRKYTGN